MKNKKGTNVVLIWIVVIMTFIMGANPWIFLYSPLYQDNNYQKSFSTYLYSDYNLSLNDPGLEQIDFIQDLPGVESVFSLYRYASRVTNLSNQTQHQTYGVFSEDFSTMSISQFNDRRLLEKLNVDPVYYAYIDRTIAESLSLELGDSIQINLTTFNVLIPLTVSRIYETDSMYMTNERSGLVFFPYVANIKSTIESVIDHKLRLKTLLIKTTQLESNVNFLKANYIPEGRLKDREDFDSQREYDEYFEAFMASSYPDDVSSKISALNTRNQLLLDSINNDLTWSEFISTQLSYLILFLGVFLIHIVTTFSVQRFKFEYNRSQYLLNRVLWMPIIFSISSSFAYFFNLFLLATFFPLLGTQGSQVLSLLPSLIVLLLGIFLSIVGYLYQLNRLKPKSTAQLNSIDEPVFNFWLDVQTVIDPSNENQQFQWVFDQVKKSNQINLTNAQIKQLVENGKTLYLSFIKNKKQ
jgi:hypothetical protein